MTEGIDISETRLWQEHPEVLQKLLKDRATRENIFWATDSYADRGEGYQWADHIIPEHITGECGMVIRPRAVKTAEEQAVRVKDKAEVFTPSWVCNAQNNLVDAAWFGREGVFNTEEVLPDGTHVWHTTENAIDFSTTGRTWQDYVRDVRMEITCGEAPYLASRYDTVSGRPIAVGDRIGLLDRKLRVVGENVTKEGEWVFWAKVALSACYGYEWQGDSLLLAREAMFFTVVDFFEHKFAGSFPARSMDGLAHIISWNLWQMDGLRCVVPGSCEGKFAKDLSGESTPLVCEACRKGTVKGHIGTRCRIAEWRINKTQRRVYRDTSKDKGEKEKGVVFASLIRDVK